MSSLGEDFPKEQARCRELLVEYKAIGLPGMFGVITLKDILQRADKAIISGNVVEMVLVYQEMKECK